MGAFSEGLKAGTLLGQSIVENQRNSRLDAQKKIKQEQDRENKQLELNISSAQKTITGLTAFLSKPAGSPGGKKTQIEFFNKGMIPALAQLGVEGVAPITEFSPELSTAAKDIQDLIKNSGNLPEAEVQQGINQIILSAGLDLKGFQGAEQQRQSIDTPSRQREATLTDEEQRNAALIESGQMLSVKEQADISKKAEKDALDLFGTSLNKMVDGASQESKTSFFQDLQDTGEPNVALLDSQEEIKTLKGMPADTAGKFALTLTATDRFQTDIMDEMFNSKGGLDKQLLLEIAANITPRARRVVSALKTVEASLLRPVSGAVLSETEIADIKKAHQPSVFFSDAESARINLEAARTQMQSFLDLVDPNKEHRNNIQKLRKSRKKEGGGITPEEVRSNLDILIGK